MYKVGNVDDFDSEQLHNFECWL